jgi:hypothetical protein
MCKSEGKQCPLKEGPFSFSKSVILPAYIPNGNYEVKLTFYDDAGPEIACVLVNFAIAQGDKIEIV